MLAQLDSMPVIWQTPNNHQILHKINLKLHETPGPPLHADASRQVTPKASAEFRCAVVVAPPSDLSRRQKYGKNDDSKNIGKVISVREWNGEVKKKPELSEI